MSILSQDIRRASIADAKAISQVHSASWRQAYAGILPHRALDQMVRRRDETWWRRAIQRSTVILVAEFNGQVVGYATLGPNRVSTLPQEGEIYEIYLLPEYQGIGLGTGLFLDARRALMRLKMNGTVVWVLAENEPAVQFYRNAGGVAIAEGDEKFDRQTCEKLAFAWK